MLAGVRGIHQPEGFMKDTPKFSFSASYHFNKLGWFIKTGGGKNSGSHIS